MERDQATRRLLRWHPGVVVLLALVLSLFGTHSPVGAAEVHQVSIDRQGNSYVIQVEMVVRAAAHRVRRVLVDYRHIYRLNPSIIESEVVAAADDDAVRVRMLVKSCVAAFCVEAARVEDVRELASGDLHATVVPELSDFRSGTATWRIQAEGGQTRVIYQGRMEPDFFVPPLVGTYFVKRSIRRDIVGTFNRLECIAGVTLDAGPTRLASIADQAEPSFGCPG